jgi:excisionase family DNA binding protein
MRPKQKPKPTPDFCDELPLAYSIHNFCKAIGLGRTKVYELIAAGQLRPLKIGKRTLITRTAAEEFLTSFQREMDGGGV